MPAPDPAAALRQGDAMLRLHLPKSGGKAGKGKNRTSTIQLRDENNCIVKQFRYVVGKDGSYQRALRKAMVYNHND